MSLYLNMINSVVKGVLPQFPMRSIGFPTYLFKSCNTADIESCFDIESYCSFHILSHRICYCIDFVT